MLWDCRQLLSRMSEIKTPVSFLMSCFVDALLVQWYLCICYVMVCKTMMM